jgi:hypothetical protein
VFEGASKGSGGINTEGVGRGGGGTALSEGGTGASASGSGGGGSGSGVGGGSGGRGAYKPGRSSENIQLTFDRNKASLNALYQRALREAGDLHGGVVVELVIEPSGAVSKCRVLSSELRNPELEAKIVNRIMLMNFGAEDVPVFTGKQRLDFYPS